MSALAEAFAQIIDGIARAVSSPWNRDTPSREPAAFGGPSIAEFDRIVERAGAQVERTLARFESAQHQMQNMARTQVHIQNMAQAKAELVRMGVVGKYSNESHPTYAQLRELIDEGASPMAIRLLMEVCEMPVDNTITGELEGVESLPSFSEEYDGEDLGVGTDGELGMEE